MKKTPQHTPPCSHSSLRATIISKSLYLSVIAAILFFSTSLMAVSDRHRYGKHYDNGSKSFGHYDNDHGAMLGGIFGDSMVDYDTDDNGKLSSTERTALMTARFGKIDANNNNNLSTAEFEKFFTQNVEREAKARFVMKDLDSSGELEAAELNFRDRNRSRRDYRDSTGPRGEHFDMAAADANNNDVLSEKEFLAFIHLNSTRHAKATFIRTDLDQNGKISVTEFASMMSPRGFARRDARDFGRRDY